MTLQTKPSAFKFTQTVGTWDPTTPPGLNYQTHKFSLIDSILTTANKGGSHVPYRVDVSGDLAAVIESLPQFIPSQRISGVHRAVAVAVTGFLGELSSYSVWLDKALPKLSFRVTTLDVVEKVPDISRDNIDQEFSDWKSKQTS